jgi:hypothetical protein
MSALFYGIYRSLSTIQIESIEETNNHKEFSNVVKIENGQDKNGNGNFYMKIFTQGEFKEMVSGNWKVNPLINCSYNWTNEWAKIDAIDTNNKEIQCSTIIDWRSIYKRNGDYTQGIKSVFNFILSLRNYINVEHYLLCNKIDKTLKDWEYYDHDDVILSPKELEEAVKRLIEINKEFDVLQTGVNNSENLVVLTDMRNNKLARLHEKYNLFINKGSN